MNRIEQLAQRFEAHVSLPWQKNLASPEKTIFIVYPKDDERRLRAKRDLFAQASSKAGHPWKEILLDSAFAEWMKTQDYAEDYFEFPEDIGQKLESDFTDFVAEKIKANFVSESEEGVVGLFGVGGLFGFTKVSAVLRCLEGSVRGRLVIFFPGSHAENTYHLLDARDGWGYMAFPITLNEVSYT
jgi:hypothetical protein